MRSSSIRRSTTASLILRPLSWKYSNPFPRRRRRIPGPEQSAFLSRAMGANHSPASRAKTPVSARPPRRILRSMPSPLDGLAAAQREAVTHPSGPLLVLGGAGTGKTRVLTRRFAWLVEQGTPPDGVVALVFSP